MPEQVSKPELPYRSDESEESIIPTAETSGITRLSMIESETEGAHLRRVADELSGSGEERISQLHATLAHRDPGERVTAARELGKIGSIRAIQLLRDLLVSSHEDSWRLAIHGLRTGGSREGWLCLEGVAHDDAVQLAYANERASNISFKRLMAMGRTKMMDRLFRAADGHSRSIPGEVARQFSIDAVATLPTDHQDVMEHRLGLLSGGAATPSDTAKALGVSLDRVRSIELESWQLIHSPIEIDR
ncbi:MAG: HEAT repeat domain-containing protein [Dehalococcoidia bacterium]|jgi:hypothetical protein|nr:HEAT repeat domain-containing protein [Dehalococcoidia bacterium]